MKKRQTSVIPQVQHLETSGNNVDTLGEQSLLTESPNAPTTLVKNEMNNRSQEDLLECLNFGNFQGP